MKASQTYRIFLVSHGYMGEAEKNVDIVGKAGLSKRTRLRIGKRASISRRLRILNTIQSLP